MRYDCEDGADSGGSFVEYSDRWSRAEVRAAWAADDATLLDILRPKIVGLRLLCGDGSYLERAEDLTVEALDTVDMRVYLWFAATWVRCLNELSDLGNAWRRRLFATSEPEAAMGLPPPSPAPEMETATVA